MILLFMFRVNSLGAGWIGPHTDYSYYLPCYLNWWIRVTVTPSFVSLESSSSSEQRLLVGGVADQDGARLLVSGVEEIDSWPEDPIVHLSPPYHGVEPRGEVPC